MKKWMFIVLIFVIPWVSSATVPKWQIIPNESSITFTATQNGAPVTGEFKSFSGEINASPDQLNESNVKIIVDIASLSDPYNQLKDTLKSKDWFNVEAFPKAIFTSNKFVKTGDKEYQSQGTLTIRDKTVPITFTFTQEEYTKSKGKIKGSVTIKRTKFGVGQGEWADTTAVKDDVLVNFVITAVRE